MLNNHRLIENQERGFSLVELLVSIFIISVITGSVLTGFWRGQNQYAVTVAVQKFQVNLRRVQNMALAGKQMPAGCVIPNCAKGFGVYSDSATRYILFYNTDSSTIYDSGTSVMLESVILEKVTLSPTGKSIFFVPPDPTTYINGVNSGSQVFIISSGLYSKNLTVYFSGLIEAN